jgi:hypothetical protein
MLLMVMAACSRGGAGPDRLRVEPGFAYRVQRRRIGLFAGFNPQRARAQLEAQRAYAGNRLQRAAYVRFLGAAVHGGDTECAPPPAPGTATAAVWGAPQQSPVGTSWPEARVFSGFMA